MTNLRTAAQAIIDAVHSQHCLLEFRDCALIEELEIALKVAAPANDDKRKPIAWQVQTEHYGVGYSFSEEFLEAFPRFPYPVEPVMCSYPNCQTTAGCVGSCKAPQYITPPSVDVPRFTLNDAQWQAFLDKLDSPVQDKPELAKLLRGDVDALIAEAVAKEREACAQIAEEWDKTHPTTNYGKCIAVDIRTRWRK